MYSKKHICTLHYRLHTLQKLKTWKNHIQYTHYMCWKNNKHTSHATYPSHYNTMHYIRWFYYVLYPICVNHWKDINCCKLQIILCVKNSRMKNKHELELHSSIIWIYFPTNKLFSMNESKTKKKKSCTSIHWWFNGFWILVNDDWHTKIILIKFTSVNESICQQSILCIKKKKEGKIQRGLNRFIIVRSEWVTESIING